MSVKEHIIAKHFSYMLNMKTYGYIKKSISGQTMLLARQQLAGAGCDSIIYDDENNWITRPNFKELVRKLRSGDTLVIYKFANVIRSAIQLSYLLETCRNRNVRIISTGDMIDTDGCPSENWVAMLCSLPSDLKADQRDATVARTADQHFAVSPNHARYENKKVRNTIAIELYQKGDKSDEICDQLGISRSTLFRILRANGIALQRRGQDRSKELTGLDATEC